ncbi:hypothetical protein CALVIDRAFT_137847 [Calocera viscosa TUFC12733]|uniref:Uncharacterized protein n=1 Tax=Calocera viscosa (strain TUFC12733) TaxID=1330018 RepID=A0A167M0D7_CALVF|nr:hypothetical protein CALVIDRAFT_137847 [Calocera viscosa TUFC12733]
MKAFQFDPQDAKTRRSCWPPEGTSQPNLECAASMLIASQYRPCTRKRIETTPSSLEVAPPSHACVAVLAYTPPRYHSSSGRWGAQKTTASMGSEALQYRYANVGSDNQVQQHALSEKASQAQGMIIIAETELEQCMLLCTADMRSHSITCLQPQL